MAKKVLVVDNEPYIRNITMRFLQIGMFIGYSAGNPRTGFESVETHQPHLVVTDFDMKSDTNGYEFARELRERDYRGKIMLAASNAEDIRRQYADADSLFDGYLEKPYGMERFLMSVRNLIGKPESQ